MSGIDNPKWKPKLPTTHAVFVCSKYDAACAEIRVNSRCADCPLGGKLTDEMPNTDSVPATDCTEPNREACPRKCVDFCNKAEEAKGCDFCRDPLFAGLKCPQCGRAAYGVQPVQERRCALCNGVGFYGSPGKRCEVCDGKGKVPVPPARGTPVVCNYCGDEGHNAHNCGRVTDGVQKD